MDRSSHFWILTLQYSKRFTRKPCLVSVRHPHHVRRGGAVPVLFVVAPPELLRLPLGHFVVAVTFVFKLLPFLNFSRSSSVTFNRIH